MRLDIVARRTQIVRFPGDRDNAGRAHREGDKHYSRAEVAGCAVDDNDLTRATIAA